MKYLLPVSLWLLITGIQAQDFTRSSESAFFYVGGNIDTADVDGDGDVDLLLSGRRRLVGPELMLYKNDGFGTFTETSFRFSNFVGSADFGDIDGDGDPDVLLSGATNGGNFITNLYLNNGEGIFSKVINNLFDGLRSSNAYFMDVDRDNDLDIIVAGQRYFADVDSWENTISVFSNDGAGEFERMENTPFDDFNDGYPTFIDLNGDENLDLLLVGSENELYLNDGNGGFILSSVKLPNTSAGISAISDFDLDGDLDLILVDSPNFTTYLCWNDGKGNFQESGQTPFRNGVYGSSCVGDVNGDFFPDVLLTGLTTDPDARTESYLYLNDGKGDFSLVLKTPFWGSFNGSSLMADVDGDDDLDIIISGQLAPVQGEPQFYNTSLYLNNNVTTTLSKEHINQISFSLIPDPSSNLLKISFESESSGQVDIQVFDLHGRLIRDFQKRVGKGAQEVSLDQTYLLPGTYVLSLFYANSFGTKKFTVSH